VINLLLTVVNECMLHHTACHRQTLLHKKLQIYKPTMITKK